MTRRYSNTAVQTTLSSGVTAVATTIPVTSTTGFPAVDFILALDADESTQELVLVTGIAGLNLTVTRGYDNTVASAHDAGAVVRHSHAAIDFSEAQEHRDATAAHGATGAVVGTTNTQALSNKDLSAASNTFPATLATTAQVDAASSTAATNLTTHEADTSTHGVTEIVGRTEVQTLTNKTLSTPTINSPTIASPTITGNVTMDGKLQAGTNSITPSAADTTTTKTITFPVAFGVVPKVTITDATGVATGYNVALWVAHADITTTGFVVRIRKGNTNPTDFTWIAVRA